VGQTNELFDVRAEHKNEKPASTAQNVISRDNQINMQNSNLEWVSISFKEAFF